jgi:hypothetical protein
MQSSVSQQQGTESWETHPPTDQTVYELFDSGSATWLYGKASQISAPPGSRVLQINFSCAQSGQHHQVAEEII